MTTEPTAPAEARESVEELLAAHDDCDWVSEDGVTAHWSCGVTTKAFGLTDAERNRAHVASLLAEREAEVVRETLLAAADELARLDRIGQTRRDLISDADWEWFTKHPLREFAPHLAGETARTAGPWLRDRADARDRGGMGGGSDV